MNNDLLAALKHIQARVHEHHGVNDDELSLLLDLLPEIIERLERAERERAELRQMLFREAILRGDP